ncbi:hypothetical protein EDD15DRAFT_2195941 [Pisolithus albus]|nr:hypothetical protein EDD15DRAFT_2195941 [Pisolithus albus]
MPTYTKGRPYADKENFDVEGQGPRARRPSEKQRLLTSEQQELVQRREIRAQREWKRDRLRKLAEAGSENGGSDGVADDDLHIVATKLSGVAKEGLSYSKNKVPKPPPTTVDIDQWELMSSSDEDSDEPRMRPHPPSDRQMTKHKRTKEKNMGNTTLEVEDTLTVVDEREVHPSPL